MIGSTMDQKLCSGWSPLAQQKRLKMDKNHRFILDRAWIEFGFSNFPVHAFLVRFGCTSHVKDCEHDGNF